MLKFLSLVLCLFVLNACKVTEKTVDLASTGTSSITSDESTNSGNGGNNSGGGSTQSIDAKVTSHINNQEVSAQVVAISGDCSSGLGNVSVSGDVSAAPVSLDCENNRFSGFVTLLNFNGDNQITVSQGSGANLNQSSVNLSLFARAPFCGDGTINQGFEVCDGSSDCNEFCQSTSFSHPDLVLARVRVNSVSNQGNGSMTSNVFLGSETHSIPAGTWFPVFFNGTFFFDAQTGTFDQAPGILVRRIGSEVKLMMSTGLTSSDFEHVDGRLEFQNASAIGIRNGIGSEAAENANDGVAELDPDQDETVIESGVSHFWLSEDTGDDAYFTEWN